jgi:hypothetical protein
METTELKPAAPTNVNDFPKTYQASPIKRLFGAAIGMISFLPSVAFFIDTTSPPLSGLHRIFIWVVVALFPVVGTWLVTLSLTSKVTLYFDRIEHSWLFGARSIAREEIQGYRISAGRGAKFVNFISINDRLKVVSVPCAFTHGDAVFSAWLKDLRNLDMGMK